MKEKKLVKFINDNDLSFRGSGSQLNGSCTVLAGYADHIDADLHEVIESVKESESTKRLTPTVRAEVKRVFEFATTYNYGKFWSKPKAKKLYKF